LFASVITELFMITNTTLRIPIDPRNTLTPSSLHVNSVTLVVEMDDTLAPPFSFLCDDSQPKVCMHSNLTF